MRFSLQSTAVTTAALLLLLASLQAVATSKPQADAFAKKLAIIKQHAERSPETARRTTVTEGELNSWFVYRAPALLPTGVKDPRVTVVGNGKLLGVVTVDLEDIGKQRSSGGSLDAWKLLGGRLPISLTGILRTKDGRGQFELQGADIAGIPVPRVLVQEIVTHYTRSDEKPNGVRLDEQFSLPASIKQIDVGQGQAVVVQ
jgi:hypothetical protein